MDANSHTPFRFLIVNHVMTAIGAQRALNFVMNANALNAALITMRVLVLPREAVTLETASNCSSTARPSATQALKPTR